MCGLYVRHLQGSAAISRPADGSGPSIVRGPVVGGRSVSTAYASPIRRRRPSNWTTRPRGQPDIQRGAAGHVVRRNCIEPSIEPSPVGSRGSGAMVKALGSALKGGQQEGFDRFWETWPKRVAKGDAQKAWAKLDPDDDLTERIVALVCAACAPEQWRRDGRRFIPYRATCLRRQGWEDEHRVCVEHVPDRGPCRPSRFDGTLNVLNELFAGGHEARKPSSRASPTWRRPPTRGCIGSGWSSTGTTSAGMRDDLLMDVCRTVVVPVPSSKKTDSHWRERMLYFTPMWVGLMSSSL